MALYLNVPMACGALSLNLPQKLKIEDYEDDGIDYFPGFEIN